MDVELECRNNEIKIHLGHSHGKYLAVETDLNTVRTIRNIVRCNIVR